MEINKKNEKLLINVMFSTVNEKMVLNIPEVKKFIQSIKSNKDYYKYEREKQVCNIPIKYIHSNGSTNRIN